MSQLHRRARPLLGGLLLVPAASSCKSQEPPVPQRASASAPVPASNVDEPASVLPSVRPASTPPRPTTSAAKLPPGTQAMMSYFIDEVCEGAACDPEVELLRGAVETYLEDACNDAWSAPARRDGVCKTREGKTLFTVTPLGAGAMSQAGVEEVILQIQEDSPAATQSASYLFLMRWQDTRFVPWVALRGESPLRATSGEVVALPAIEGDKIQRLAQWRLPGEAMVQFYCTSAAFHGEFQQSCFAVSAADAAGDLHFEFSSNTGLAAMPGDRYLQRELVGVSPLTLAQGDPAKASGVKLDAEYSEGLLEETDLGGTRQRHLVHEKLSFEIRLKDGQLVSTPAVPKRYQ